MRTSKILTFLATLSLLLSGCFRPQGRSAEELERRQRKDASAASWLAQSVSGRSQVARVHRIFQVPEAKLYNFDVCVQDRRTQEPLGGHEFHVSGGLPSTKDKVIRADAQGCLHWSEQIDFDFFAGAKYLPFSFQIEPQKGHSGSREILFAINPWLDGSDEVIDLSRKSVPQEQLLKEVDVHARLRGEVDRAQPLVIDPLNVEIQKSTGSAATLRLTMKPSVWRADVEDKKTIFVLREGRFHLDVRIVAVTDHAVVSLQQYELKDQAMLNGQLGVQQTLGAIARPTSGHIELHLRVQPVGGPASLGTFEGKFRLGGVDALSGSRSLSLQPDVSAKPGKTPLGEGPSGTSRDALKDGPGASQMLAPVAFELSRFTGRHERVVEENAISRTLEFSVGTCVTDPNENGRRVRNRSFIVTSESGFSARLESDLDGCLEWRDRITHQYYQEEKLFLRRYTVSDGTGTSSRVAVLNPWEDQSYGYFVQDLDRVTPEVVEQTNARNFPAPQILIPEFAFQTGQTQQSIDEFLSLRVHRKVVLRLEPRVLRPSIRRGLGNVEPLRKGTYLLKAVLHRSHREGDQPLEFVSGVQKLVEVADGRIVTPLEFTFRDLRFLTMRNHFVVELAPVDPALLGSDSRLALLRDGENGDRWVARDSGLAGRSFIGPAVPGERANGSLRPTDDLDESFCRTLDCDQLKLSQSSRSADPDLERFYGGIRYLAGTSATQLLARGAELDAVYVSRMRAKARASEFARLNNMEFVTFSNESALRASDPGVGASNRVLKMPGADVKWSEGWARSSAALGVTEDPLVRNTVIEWLNGREISPRESARLCGWWMREFLPSLAGTKKFFASDRQMRKAVHRCVAAYDSGRVGLFGFFQKESTRAFSLERKFRVLELGKNEFVARGWKQDYQIASTFALSSAETKSRSSTVEMAPTAILRLLPSKIFTSLMSAVDYAVSWTHTHSQSAVQETSATGFVILQTEASEGPLSIRRHEKCAALRLNPLVVEQIQKERFLSTDLSDAERSRILTRGVFVCKGKSEATPIEVKERYYYFSTPGYDEIQNDRFEGRNQPWMLAVRGRGDFERFVSLLEARPQNGPQVVPQAKSASSRLEAHLQAAYRRQLPAFPGFYTWLPTEVPTPSVDARQDQAR